MLDKDWESTGLIVWQLEMHYKELEGKKYPVYYKKKEN